MIKQQMEKATNPKRLSGRNPSTGTGIQVTMDAGIIVEIEPVESCDNLWISAGLIDLQVNGYRGLDLNGTDLTSETVSGLVRSLLSTGVTSFVPTICTAPEEEILQRLAAISQARSNDSITAACIPFIHVEGPHISPYDGFRGAHQLNFVRPPSLHEFDAWQAVCENLVGLVTLSPHFAGVEEYIGVLTERGIHIALGHTHASEDQVRAAVNAGARLSTHLGNGLALQIDRHHNPIWSQLADDRLAASFIADGHHLPAGALKALISAKGLERSILVSDSVALAGMPAGEYNAPIGGQVELSADGRITLAGTSILAGAAIPLSECVGRAVQMLGRSLAEVLTMVTQNPGHFIGDRGMLSVGSRADILRFHWDLPERILRVEDVTLAGETAYKTMH